MTAYSARQYTQVMQALKLLHSSEPVTDAERFEHARLLREQIAREVAAKAGQVPLTFGRAE